MASSVERASYYALRRCAGTNADAWWFNASRHRDMPSAIVALMGGRGRVEVSAEETIEALAWAERVDGWQKTEDPPFVVHPRDPRDN